MISGIEWLARVECPLCGSSHRTHLLEKQGGTYVQCADCKLVYASPAQCDQHLEAMADEWGNQILCQFQRK